MAMTAIPTRRTFLQELRRDPAGPVRTVGTAREVRIRLLVNARAVLQSVIDVPLTSRARAFEEDHRDAGAVSGLLPNPVGESLKSAIGSHVASTRRHLDRSL